MLHPAKRMVLNCRAQPVGRCEKVTIWHGLLVNLAILSIFVSIWMQAYDAIGRMAVWLRTLTLSVLFIAGVITVILLPFQITTGIQADLRTTLIVLAGLFGGPVVVAGTTVAALVLRAVIGGQGAAQGMAGIAAILIVAAACHFMLRGRRPRAPDVLLASAAGAGGLPAAWLLWSGYPSQQMFVDAWIPIVTIVFVATAIAGLSIVREERRAAATRENELYAAAFKALPNLMNVKDRSGRFVIANPATATAMGVSNPESLIGRTVFDFYSDEIAGSFERDDDRVFNEGTATTERRRAEFADGSVHWLKTTKAPLHDRSGAVVGVITHDVDVTQSELLADANEEMRRQLAEALENMSDGLAVFDAENRIVICNSQYSALFPRTADLRMPGSRLQDILRAAIAREEEALLPGVTLEQWIDRVSTDLTREGTREIHLFDGRWIAVRVRTSHDGRSLSLVTDITAAKMAQQALVSSNIALEALAQTDSLTGLDNRRAFDAALAREFARSTRNQSPLSVLMVDVDRFKAYNDAYGHPQGDECLKQVARMLKSSARRPGDVAARYGGEEFAILLPDTDAESAAAVAELVRWGLGELAIPHKDSDSARVTVTIGTATVVRSDRAPGDLLRRADWALYLGKTSGRDQIRSSQGDDAIVARLAG